jgi:hypothetical protein
MDPVTSQSTKWAEIREHGLFGRQLEPVFHSKMGKLLVLVLGAASVGITFYWMFTYSGPYRTLAELQLKWIGSYERNLTCLLVFSGLFLGLLFGLLGIVVAIKLLLRGAERPVPGMPTAPIATPGIAPAAIPQPAIQLSERYQRNVRYAVLFATPLILVGMGAYSYYNGTQVGSLQQLSVADFQSGKVQSHIVYADVRGRLSGHYISKNDYLYIPMTSEKNSASPVHLLVGVNENETRKYLHREADGTYGVRGIADKRLEGDVKYAFEKNGTSMADTVWVVHAGRAPSDDRRMGLSVMGFGVVFAGLLFAWQSYQKRKRGASLPMQPAA